ncbi:hypothetical protein, partial [Streptococcus suis]|uniref:hypothetical protein n=1 Tax=Streptococcus suis TaxID=1307 RepID=UPI001EE0F1BF
VVVGLVLVAARRAVVPSLVLGCSALRLASIVSILEDDSGEERAVVSVGNSTSFTELSVEDEVVVVSSVFARWSF